ncbi:U6 snRNA-associated Sm-like protein LSm7, putative [Plasmodium knowlesi strain H]|uniref:U6 snRNA-associated Sm-like protein LSm7, putative n=3 Tax=Plasmodium knowlesi TaxID=5850 RepID=A0A5K1VSC3_PLAKH|nr:U6 snRNA-associated Sm-like protein LSm7, putative [Plasmodium knowlesi strain H]OTN66871.1 putative U6 snRNA-associated Sm-like protein LSm7 [Plasmodium knowlesi]CAA9990130.1 U6 snRNA-associated Sm-like protein LSm7, putative [Plasmodium knowlesi strain H]SBO25814.1 U6 snRNA-associated Sm-like protein LSm7, putative [Plasmodium knowlesi strain H]SBO28603.1 U6 snRNA-associated Sm-like protein LSm7, putative [Plasmodium knowlesi strain H]VVS79604.1 U6 snRNA-associated Sm-like protein LSm7, p|eukprot:XP_002260597.1 u6 snrna-associated sm-like protein [Plasmodium knowlesi strain H]
MSVLPTTPAYNKENKFMTDIKKFMNQKIRVKFDGGREVVGNLIGHDAIFNLVLDKTEEYIRDPNDSLVITEKTRSIGLVVARGTSIALITPVDGTQEIANPFISEEK